MTVAAPVLLATLYAAGGQVATFFDALGAGINNPATMEGLKDGSDSTFGNGAWAGDGIDANSGYYAEDWALDPFMLTEAPIGFVLIVARCKKEETGTFGQICTISPRVNGVKVVDFPGGLATSFGNGLSYQLQRDPADNQPWTAAKINAQKFGWQIDAANADVLDTLAGDVSEFQVQVWSGEDTTPTVGGGFRKLAPSGVVYRQRRVSGTEFIIGNSGGAPPDYLPGSPGAPPAFVPISGGGGDYTPLAVPVRPYRRV